MRKNFVDNYDNLSDNEIVELINKGEYELLKIIFKRYFPIIYYYTNKYCNKSDKEDAIQEATYALYSAAKTYDNTKSSFSTFATLCIKRSVISGLKSVSRGKNVPDELLDPIEDHTIVDCNSPEKIFFDKINYKSLTDNIKLELSSMEYKVLRLYLSGKKYSEISELLSISEKSVDNCLTRIRKKLRNK